MQYNLIEHKKLYALTRVLGLKNVYCVLNVITQIGSIAHIEHIENIFNYIVNTMLQPIEKKYRKLQS